MDWDITQVGDVGGDGKADVIWRNSTSGQVTMWVVNGTLLAGSNVVATSVPLKWIIQNGEPNSPPLFGLNFIPKFNGQGPNLTSQISESQIRESIGLIRPYTKWVRTFTCGDGFEKSGRIAHQLGLKAAIGGWLGRDPTANQQQIDCLINVANAGDADLVIVGNEALLRGDITDTALVNLINQIKQAVPEDIPVGYADVYSELLSHTNVMEAMDVILVNYYPYWEGVQVDFGMASIHGHHQQINLAANGKPVVVGETGWPTGGDIVGKATPSEENACFFFQNFISWAEANAVDYYFFSSFDEGWKGENEDLRGADLGFWDKTQALTPCVQETLEGKRIEDNWSGINILGW
jgi:exo-beta-1,3-glucanase (GH17 family)